MTNNPHNLLPCPFCGELPVLTKHFRYDDYSFIHRCPVVGPINRDFCPPELHVKNWNTRAALAEPVPPAGGEVKVDTYICYHGELVRYSDLKPTQSVGPLVFHDDFEAHVTRLQAEVERLKQVAIDRKNELTSMCTQVVDLQSELTKAQELFKIIDKAGVYAVRVGGGPGVRERVKYFLEGWPMPDDNYDVKITFEKDGQS